MSNSDKSSYNIHFGTTQYTFTWDGETMETGLDVIERPYTNYVNFSDNINAWRDRMVAGENVSTEEEGLRYKVRQSTGEVSANNVAFNQYYQISGHVNSTKLILPSNVVPAASLNEAKAKAAIDFSKKYRKLTRKFQTGVFVGEILETARMLASPGRALFKSIMQQSRVMTKIAKQSNVLAKKGGGLDLSRVTSQSLRRANSALASSWLEYRFGITPLIQDLDDAANAFRAMASGRQFDIHRLTGVGEVDFELAKAKLQPWETAWPGFPGPQRNRVYKDLYGTVSYTLRGAWRNSNPSELMPVPMTLGLSLDNFIPTIWELLPGSFLADYFLSIGDSLDAWQMRFVDLAWLNGTTRSSVTVRYSDVMKGKPSSGIVYTARGGHCYATRRYVGRELNPSDAWDLRLLHKLPLSNIRKGNIAALLALKLRRGYSY